jgi:hypothetical protein
MGWILVGDSITPWKPEPVSQSEPLSRAIDYDGHVLEIHSRPAIRGV